MFNLSNLHTNLFTSNGSVSDTYQGFLQDQKRYFRMSVILSVIAIIVLPIAFVQSSHWFFAVAAFGLWASLIAKHDESNCNYMMHMIDYLEFRRTHPNSQ